MRQYAIYGKDRGSKSKYGGIIFYQQESTAKRALANARRNTKTKGSTFYGMTITRVKRVQ